MAITTKPIPGFDGYRATSDGRIESSKSGKWQTRKEYSGPYGYKTIGLSIGGKCKTLRVHVMVALAFLGVRPPKHDINHIDGDKHNNNASNLEYVTRSQNLIHARSLGLRTNVLTLRQAQEIYLRAESGESHTSIARDFPTSRRNVSYIAGGNIWQQRIKEAA
jgi:hypothetical protein